MKTTLRILTYVRAILPGLIASIVAYLITFMGKQYLLSHEKKSESDKPSYMQFDSE